jgi:hypothetical protein
LLHLSSDDHREGGLAKPWRSRKQNVVRRCPAGTCGLQHQPELLAHPLLPDELRELLRPQRSLKCSVVTV